MKFKNYRNPYTNDNRIYSFKDLYNMPFGELIRNKQEVLGQYRVLGVPTEKELQGSENVIWVEAYKRDDGTEVKGHWRSRPEGSSSEPNNNQTTKDITEENKQGDLTGGASEVKQVNNSADKKNFTENKNKYVKPVEGKITSNFGYRTAPTNGATSNHSGIDIAVPVGTPVKSIADGTVVAANGGMRGYGNGIFVDHGIINGKHVVSEYGHLDSFNVKIGDKVKQGQVIAKSGNTGVSTGPHLHITIREDKKPVDPKKYIGNFSESN